MSASHSTRPEARRSQLLSSGLALIVWLVAAPPPAGAASGQASTDLFIETARQGTVSPEDPTMIRQRPVEIDFSALGGTAPRAGNVASALELNLFADAAFTATLGRAEDLRSGSTLWQGALAGYDGSSVLLVAKAGVVVGNIRVDGKLFQVQYRGGGVHAVAEIDPSRFPDELPPTEVAFTPELPVEAVVGDGEGGGGDGSVYDLLVVYTSTSRQNAGGVTAIENWIDLAVAETNQGYATSLMNTRTQLLHTEEVSYNESGSLFTDRNRLQNPSDGFLDEVHGVRDLHGADIVTLIIENPGCGVAYIMTTVSTAFADFGFNVTKRTCAVGNYTFGHEIGHLQGARHDWFVDSTNGSPFTYNHGYVDPSSQWRSVMAYSNGCGGCQRQLFFSNPNRNHPTTGNATGVPDGQSQAADNHKTIDTTAPVVSQWRQRTGYIFDDGFEGGDISSWSASEGGGL